MSYQLKEEIHKRGESITGFAKRVGMNKQTIMNIGKKKGKASDLTMWKVANGLGVTLDEAREICQ